jgi:hypothetical protein
VRVRVQARPADWGVPSGDVRDGFTLPFSRISERFQIFRGTYLAHAQVHFVEFVQLFLILANPHNLKVIGSNPIPATKFTM